MKLGLVIGTGRCGTVSAANLLDAQPGVRAYHEPRQADGALLPWKPSEATESVRERYERLAGGSDGLVVEASFWLMPYIESILAEFPDARIVVLKRPLEETVCSYVRKVRSHHGWDVDHWRANRGGLRETEWCRCYPKFNVATLEEGVRAYWHHYHREVNRLIDKHPHNVTIMRHDLAVSHPAKMHELMDWLGVEREGRRLIPQHANRAIGGDPEAVTTAIVKTFEREDCLRQLVWSMKEHYPRMRLLIADSSAEPYAKRVIAEEGVEHIATAHHLDFDAGGAAGRNYLIHRVETPYTLLLDDDLAITRETNVAKLLDTLDRYGLDYACAAYREKNRINRWIACLRQEGDDLRSYPAEPVEPFTLVHLGQIFGLARTDKLQAFGEDGPLDPELLTGGHHVDLFLRLREAGLVVGYVPGVYADHSMIRPETYSRYRRRHRDFELMMLQKRGLRRFVRPNGKAGAENNQLVADGAR